MAEGFRGLILRPPQWWLFAEFVALYVGVPAVTYAFRSSFGMMIIPTLVVAGLVMLLLLIADPDFDRKRLWNSEDFRQRIRPTIKRFLLGGLLLAAMVALRWPERLFDFPLRDPGTWAVVMVFYPVLSVYPQEIIFRTFPFHRYRRLVTSERNMIVATAIAFGLAHALFANWLALALSTAGGFIFSATYARTGSTLQSSVEHALWGDLIFTIGLGWFFYGGSVVG